VDVCPKELPVRQCSNVSPLVNPLSSQSSNDGIFTGLLLTPVIALALMINALRPFTSHSCTTALPSGWIIEAPRELHNLRGSYDAAQALLLSRYSLVSLSTLCSTILLLHIYASWLFERRYSKSPGAGEGERTSVPRNEGQRVVYYTLFTVAISAAAVTTRIMLNQRRIGIWQRRRTLLFPQLIPSLIAPTYRPHNF
jgi:hypothetical protein